MYEKEVLELQYRLRLLNWMERECNLEYLDAWQLVKDIEGLIMVRSAGQSQFE